MKKNVNAKTIDTVERERERESYTLVNISGAAVLGASVNKKLIKRHYTNVGSTVFGSSKNKIKNVEKSLTSCHAMTLMALAIMVVILIIVAGIVVNLALGDNGLFGNSRLAKDNFAISAELENIQSAFLRSSK